MIEPELTGERSGDGLEEVRRKIKLEECRHTRYRSARYKGHDLSCPYGWREDANEDAG
jgi:hypothetical protein